MKLNGKLYLKKEDIINEIEDLIIFLEQGDYRKISESISDIKVNTAENTAKNLANFQDMFIAYFKQERYCKLDVAIEMTNDNLYNPKTEKVSIFSQGAYGITIRSDDTAAEKYVFNTCLYVFTKNIKKLTEKT